MSIYTDVYITMCDRNRQRVSEYKKYSGLHQHHIKPKHMGGCDDISNLTYLTLREHKIAHFLLWKIYKNPNDLRSLAMLGGNLSVRHRQIVGEWCRDNGIGFHHNKWDNYREEWRNRGWQTQKESGRTDTFFYWSTEVGRKKRASMGGTTTWKNGSNPIFEYWASEEGRKKRASMGAAASGKNLPQMVLSPKNSKPTRIVKIFCIIIQIGGLVFIGQKILRNICLLPISNLNFGVWVDTPGKN